MTERLMMTVVYASSLFIILIAQVILPYLNRGNVVLGVTLPKVAMGLKEIKTFKHHYMTNTSWIGILYVLFSSYFVYHYPTNLFMQSMLIIVYIMLMISIYLIHHRKVTKWKSAQNFPAMPQQVRIDLQLSKNKVSNGYLWWHLIPFSLGLICTIFVLSQYDKLPANIPTHWGFDGKADAFSNKSIGSVMLPAILMWITELLVVFSHYAILRSKQQLNKDYSAESLHNLLKSRKYWSIIMVGIHTFIVMNMSPIQLMMLDILNSQTYLIITLITSPLLILIICLLGIKVGNQGEKLGSKESSYATRDDDSYWLGGLIYYNPQDPTVFIPKKVGIGYTVNLGSTLGKVFYLGILILILLLSILPFILN